MSFPALFSANFADEGTVFNSLFHTGSWVYGSNSGLVEACFFDGTRFWPSAYGTQSGATFNVTKSEKPDTPFDTSQSVGGTVSCQLVNADGEVKKLEEASFVLNFEPSF